MIIDYKANPGHARRFSIFDATTGECLDKEGIFYADDEAGYYHRHIGAPDRKYLRDARTKERFARMADVPAEFLEVAWERVDRAIAIRPGARVEVTA